MIEIRCPQAPGAASGGLARGTGRGGHSAAPPAMPAASWHA